MINVKCYSDLLDYFETRRNKLLDNAYKGFRMPGSLWHYNDLYIFTMNLEYSIVLLKKDKSILEKEIKSEVLNNQDGYIITDNYYIDLVSFNVIKFSEIVLVYKGIFAMNFGCVTKDGKLLKVRNIFVEQDNKWYESYDIVLSRCEDILVGRNKENKKILKEKYNIELKEIDGWNLLI